jgi:hypothetical protein
VKKAKVTSDSYLHVTMEVTASTTARRYPQFIVSDREAPVQDYLDQGNTVIMQIFRNWPSYVELQICEHRPWDVNNQCPFFQFLERMNNNKAIALASIDEASELTGADVLTRFDLFMSSKRAYLLMNRKLYGCVDLPATGVPKGDVTVTFGDVLYHSGADAVVGYSKNYLQYDTERRFDNLGFSSNIPAPQWDHERIPCVAASAIDIHR